MNLENWEKKDGSITADPSACKFVFVGNVFGHPTIPDGTRITTDEILGWDYQAECFVSRDNKEYRLKEPSVVYEMLHQNCLKSIRTLISKRHFMMPSWLYKMRNNAIATEHYTSAA